MSLVDELGVALRIADWALCAAAGCYLALALWFTLRFRPAGADPAAALRTAPGLTVLKPLCGGEPELEAMLASLMSQSYPGPLQVIFCARRADRGLEAARRVAGRFPHVATGFVVAPPAAGANPKVLNLMGAQPFARHDLIAISDSDVWLAPDALARAVRGFEDPGVGAVTCLYRGLVRPRAGLLERLGALHINAWFIPSALVAAGLAPVQTGYGPLTIVRRRVLEAEGGFEALAWRLADDHELGQMAVRQGFRVALSDVVVATLTPEQTLRRMLVRELRWGRTSRATNPLGYAAAVVTQPLPALLLLAGLQPAGLGWAALATLAFGRWLLAVTAELRIGHSWGALDWLVSPLVVPLREALCFMVWGWSHLGRQIVWRGRRYEVCPGAYLARAPARLEGPQLQPFGEIADA
jgi:ceramide glucosyltransferase